MSFMTEMQALAVEFASSDMFTDATIARAGTGQTYIPRTGEYEGANGTDIIGCRAVSEDVTSRAADGRIVFNTVITLTVEPRIADKITLGTRTFVVTGVKTIAPDGVAILFSATVQ